MNLRLKNILLIGIPLSIIISLFEKEIFYAFIPLALLLAVYFLGQKIVLVIIIVLQITATGEDLSIFRPYITVISFLILLFFFLKEFGLVFNKYPRIPKIILWFVGLISMTLLISSFLSIDFVTSLSALTRLIAFFIFCYLIYSQIKDVKTIYFLIISLFLSVIIVGFTMIIEFFEKGASFFVNEEALLRIAGIYENPNYVGMLLVITIPLTLGFLMIDTTIKQKYKYVLLFFLLFQIVLLLLSDSRASFLSISISTILLLFASSKNVKLIFTSIILVITINILMFLDLTAMVELFLRPERIGTRDMIWATGWNVISDNLLFGTGVDTFEKVFYSYAPSSFLEILDTSSKSNSVSPHPHNLFLYFWAENGILGLFSVILFFYAFINISIRLFRKKYQVIVANETIAISTLSILIGVFVRSFFEISGVITYGFITRDLPLWIILIILIYLYQNSEKHETHNTNESVLPN
jgi:O-antigen ligase